MNEGGEVALRQGIFAAACLDREAGAAEAADEPVLEARVIRLRRHGAHAVARRIRKRLREPRAAGRLKAVPAVINFAALRVIGDHKVGMYAAGVGGERRRLRLVERACARPSRAGAGARTPCSALIRFAVCHPAG